MNERNELATRLKEARAYTGLSQAFVAEKLGVPRSALSDIERGTRKVAADELSRLADLYGCKADALLSGEPEQPDDQTLVVLARTAGQLSEEDRAEVLHFAQFLRNRTAARHGTQR